jgi:hypothetical protein
MNVLVLVWFFASFFGTSAQASGYSEALLITYPRRIWSPFYLNPYFCIQGMYAEVLRVSICVDPALSPWTGRTLGDLLELVLKHSSHRGGLIFASMALE